jgi:hypothetical protein
MSCQYDCASPASMLLTATMPMPVPSTKRSPSASISRPAGNAKAIRRKANALTTPAAAAVPTWKLRANNGSAGATMPNPSATKNATTARTRTSRGSAAGVTGATFSCRRPDTR